MKKLLTSILTIIFTVCLALSLVGCGEKNVTPPSVVNGQDTLMTGLKKSPENYDASTVIYATLGKLDSYTTYKTQSSGTSTAKKGIISYTQTTTGESIKHGDEFYTSTDSHSAFVNFKHEAFVKNDNVAYRENDNDIKNVVRSSYESIYGVTPAKLLTGHIYNQNTIVSASGKKVDGGYEYEVILDKDAANAKLSYQMKEFGGLGGYPVFNENTVVTIVIKDDFTPVSCSYTSKYTVNVPVLGDMECTENNSVIFSDFNGDLEIPDTAAFNAAMNSTPSKIDPNKTTEKDGFDKIVSSLSSLNFRDGVSLTGSIYYNDVSVPFKFSGKADIDGLIAGTKNLSEAFDFKLSIGTLDGKIGVIYHDKTFYVSILSEKYAFTADTSSIDEYKLDLSDTENIASQLDEIFMVEESSTENDTYVISLADEYSTLVFATLKNWGIFSESDIDNFDCTIKIYMPDDKVNAIYATIGTDDNQFGINTVVAGELYYANEDFDEYATELEFGTDINLTLSPSSMGGTTFTVNCNLSVAYDTTIIDPTKAFKAEAKITLNDALKQMLPLASSMMADAPEWLSLVGTADEILVDYKDNAIYIAFTTEGKAIFVKQVDISGADFDTQREETSISQGSSILTLLPELLEFNYDKENSQLELALQDSTVDIINSVFMSELPDTILDKLGESGSLLLTLLDLSKPLSGTSLKYDIANGTLTLNVDMVNVGTSEVYNPNIEYEKSTFVSLELKPSEEISDFNFDFESAIANDAVVSTIRENIAKLNGVILTDDNAQKFTDIKTAYEALTEEQQYLVYNYANLAKYEKTAKSHKDSVDRFAKKEKKSDSTFNGFTDAQKAYFMSAYAETAEAYITSRYESEATKVKEINESIDTLNQSVENLTVDQLIDLIKQANTTMKSIDALSEKSLQDIKVDKLNVAVKAITSKYAELTITKAQEILDDLKEMGKAFEQWSTFNKSVDEMLELYNEYSEFYTNRYKTPAKNTYAWAVMNENCPELSQCFIKVNYYLTSSKGFKVGAVKSTINAIDALDAATMTSEDLASALENIKALIKIIGNDTAITNISKYNELSSVPTINEYIQVITDATGKFASLKSSEIISTNKTIVKAETLLAQLSDEFKLEIADTIANYNTALSSYVKIATDTCNARIDALKKFNDDFQALIDAGAEDFDNVEWIDDQNSTVTAFISSFPDSIETSIRVDDFNTYKETYQNYSDNYGW